MELLASSAGRRWEQGGRVGNAAGPGLGSSHGCQHALFRQVAARGGLRAHSLVLWHLQGPEGVILCAGPHRPHQRCRNPKLRCVSERSAKELDRRKAANVPGSALACSAVSRVLRL